MWEHKDQRQVVVVEVGNQVSYQASMPLVAGSVAFSRKVKISFVIVGLSLC